MYSRFWWGSLRARDNLEDPGVDGRTVGSSGSGIWGHGLDRSGSG